MRFRYHRAAGSGTPPALRGPAATDSLLAMAAPDRVTGAVVFVTTRTGTALRRRQRCLEAAGIPYSLASEARPSGTYLKLCVAECDVVDAYAALGMGGCGRGTRLVDLTGDPTTESLTQVASMLRNEAAIAAGKLVEGVRDAVPALGPALLAALRAATANRG
jgi:hypothetical protein